MNDRTETPADMSARSRCSSAGEAPPSDAVHPDRSSDALLPFERSPFNEEDPYATPEYQAFLEDVAKYCRCEYGKPCDGVLAGGMCDGLTLDERDYWSGWEEWENENTDD